MILSVRQDDGFSELLRASGFEVLNLELVATEPVADLSELRQKLVVIDKYDGLFFTSPASASVFVQEVDRSEVRCRGSVYVLGERTRQMLADAGYDVVFRESADTAAELIASLGDKEFAGKRFIFVRGNRSIRAIPELLSDIAVVDEVTVYETKEIVLENKVKTKIQRLLDRNEIDWVCLFSPSGVESFCKAFDLRRAVGLRTAAIGKTTAKSAEVNDLRVDYVAHRANAEMFARGLIEHIKSIE